MMWLICEICLRIYRTPPSHFLPHIVGMLQFRIHCRKPCCRLRTHAGIGGRHMFVWWLVFVVAVGAWHNCNMIKCLNNWHTPYINEFWLWAFILLCLLCTIVVDVVVDLTTLVLFLTPKTENYRW
mgnify:CR=1 FL=1